MNSKVQRTEERGGKKPARGSEAGEKNRQTGLGVGGWGKRKGTAKDGQRDQSEKSKSRLTGY